MCGRGGGEDLLDPLAMGTVGMMGCSRWSATEMGIRQADWIRRRMGGGTDLLPWPACGSFLVQEHNSCGLLSFLDISCVL